MKTPGIFMSLLTGMLLLFTAESFTQDPKYIWSNPEGSGRQQKVLFRNSFEIRSIPDSAKIYLFASSGYHIYVNGTHLNFGPSRFYPAHPRYDTYDLAPYLVKGKNIVAVEVLANGMETFQIFESIGSLIAWGNPDVGDGKEHSFGTPGSWKMMSVPSMDNFTPKFSFACGAVEVFDARKEPNNWQNPSFDDTNWQKPVLIANQQYWGRQEDREIPDLTQNEISAFRCLGIYEASKVENYYSFYQKTPDENQQLYGRGEGLAGYTWIFSPLEQSLELGTWWGEYYLNGEGPIKISSKDPFNLVRENRIFNLKKGWNFLFVSYQAIWGAWEFTLAVPALSNLEFSTQKKQNSTSFFKTTKALNPSNSEKLADAIKKGNTDPENFNKQISWQEHSNEIPIKNPARELVWNHPDVSKNIALNDYQTGNFSIQQPRFYVYDVGRKMLGRIFVDIEAPAGTIVDLGWSEDLNTACLLCINIL
jgi:alpha-L-rhamnosidase